MQMQGPAQEIFRQVRGDDLPPARVERPRFRLSRMAAVTAITRV
jgi:hypothetical protein